MLQIDPVGGDGVFTRWIALPGVGIKPWIWDRPRDNKVYLYAASITSAAGSYDLQQSVRFCDANLCPRF